MIRIAVPVENGRLAGHFGHAPEFAFLDADPGAKQVLKMSSEPAPPHQHGVLPPWLKSRGVAVVIAGGIGAGAVARLERESIQVVAGASAASPEALVQGYLDGTLELRPGQCNHHGHCHPHGGR